MTHAQDTTMEVEMEVSAPEITSTANGDVAYTARGVGAPLLALFFKLVRGLSPSNLAELLGVCLHDVKQAGSKAEADAMALDLFLLMASTRGVRGGKGEKDLFYDLFFAVGEAYPNQCLDLLRDGIVEEVGSFKDIKALYNRATVLLKTEAGPPTVFQKAAGASRSEREKFLQTVASECIRVFAKQLEADLKQLETHEADESENKPPLKLSLAGKWAPRESKKCWKHMAKVLALQMYAVAPRAEAGKAEAGIATALRKYRKVVARLNEALNTCEVKMCNGQWSQINPGAVPSQCLKRKRNAFLNLPNKKGGDGGITRSTDADRVQCAENFKAHLEKGGEVHGRALHVNEVVAEYFKSPAEDPILEAQWQNIRQEFLDKDSSLRKYVAMADVSGSMFSGGGRRGTGATSPITCCVALSLLISEVAHPVFRDRVLTFHSQPTWFDLNPRDSLAQKVQHLQSAPWGMNTDFYQAMCHIVQSCVSAGLTEDELPKGLVVFSDMQFDSAMHGDKADCMAKIEELWQTHGYAAAPKIVFWNLAANTTSFPATSGTKNVQMLSGFSQNLMKAFMNDTELEEVTPEMTLRNLLSEEWLDRLRSTFRPDSTAMEDDETAEQRDRVQKIEAALAK